MQNNITLNKKSGKGISDGVISELTTIFTVKPGHAEELRGACQRFAERVRQSDPQARQKSGLRDVRLVLTDDDRRLLLMTTFETDWDPYIDDAIYIIGVENWMDLLQHVSESPGGVLGLKNTTLPKQVLQTHQSPATAYWNALADWTIPEIEKALRLRQAFEQVLDDPAAAPVLQHPALKPLLEQAAD
ncbi:MAG: hypothetical protein HS126_26950 [Anaerolineales bacterium]|nr:hypothetical protein [Anaerolineales bacterium]